MTPTATAVAPTANSAASPSPTAVFTPSAPSATAVSAATISEGTAARVAGPSALIIFGAAGDLAQKKLYPAIYDLAAEGNLPANFALVGFGRAIPGGLDGYRELIRRSLTARARAPFHAEVWARLAAGIRLVEGDFGDAAAFASLRQVLDRLEVERGTGGNHAFYFSIPPTAFALVTKQLRASGLITQTVDPHRWRRVVVEKPFGRDLRTARELNATLEATFPAESIYRIDHYLGKETVQNILALRFANGIYEPLWNREHVDHIQITMAEDIGVAGRAHFYEGVGAARDVIQNHLLQVLALTAMEAPADLSAGALQAAKAELLAAVALPADLSLATARGQYGGGVQDGEPVTAFIEEPAVRPGSRTETFAALKLLINNPRWDGVPIYVRAGKRMARRATEVVVAFKDPERRLFPAPVGDPGPHNELILRIQPNEGIALRFGTKVPGTGAKVREVAMDFGYAQTFSERSPEAYERLILDVLIGDGALFPPQREIDLSWQILDPIEAYWRDLDARSHGPGGAAPLEQYAPGSYGPRSAFDLIERDGRAWRTP